MHLQKRRERGRISIRGIRLVEPAVLNLDGGDSLAPDVSHLKIKKNDFSFNELVFHPFPFYQMILCNQHKMLQLLYSVNCKFIKQFLNRV